MAVRIANEGCDYVVEFNRWHTVKGLTHVDTVKDVLSIRDVHFLQVDASVLEGRITGLG